MSIPSNILRQVGKNGPKIPSVGLGLMGFSVGYGVAHADEERLKFLDHAWEIGCRNWDTADSYADSEDVIGRWFKLHPERRADIFLATKFGLRPDPKGFMGFGADSSPEYARACLQKSLERLCVDYVDLFYMHRADSKTPIEKTVAALKQFKDEGKVKYLGLSEVSSTTLRRAYAVHPISAVQIEYSPWALEAEGAEGTDLMQTCDELNVALFAYSPLGRGILTGKYRSSKDFGPQDFRPGMDTLKDGNFEKNLELVDAFVAMAERKGCTAGQLVLAWLVAQNSHVFVIPGTKSVKYLEENFAAAQVTLTPAESKELRQTVLDVGVHGKVWKSFGAYLDTAPLKD